MFTYAEVRLNLDTVQASFLNMILSNRGAERQAPNVLQQALRFSAIMEVREKEHPKELNTEQRLRRVIDEFESQPGFNSKWTLDDSRVMSICNVICGTTSRTRQLMKEHLDLNKWSQSALTSELLRRPRWLVGASPKCAAENWKQCLTVTPESQELFMLLLFTQFAEKARKVRPNQRARMRPSNSEWDNMVSFACIFQTMIREAKLLSEGAKQDGAEDSLKKAFLAMCLDQICIKTIVSFNVSTTSFNVDFDFDWK